METYELLRNLPQITEISDPDLTLLKSPLNTNLSNGNYLLVACFCLFLQSTCRISSVTTLCR